MGDSAVAGVILAAGSSRRMGAENKLTRVWQGKPLVRHLAEAALASRLGKVALVTGAEREAVEAVLPEGLWLTPNHEHEGGMAGSIRAGLYRLQGYSPVMILLGDMPLVTPDHIDAMIEAFEAANDDATIVAASDNGKIGNPVLFGRDHFRALKLLEGDRGAGDIVRGAEKLIRVEIGEAARRDFDTPEAFER